MTRLLEAEFEQIDSDEPEPEGDAAFYALLIGVFVAGGIIGAAAMMGALL